jgi:hypothetical protein
MPDPKLLKALDAIARSMPRLRLKRAMDSEVIPDVPANPDAPRAKGRALERTDAELAELAKVTPEDIERGQALWRESAPAQYRNILDAETETP